MGKIKQFIERYKTQPEIRAITKSLISLFFNLCYLVFLIFLAIANGSLWFGAMALYYFILTTTRSFILSKSLNSFLLQEGQWLAQLKVYKNCGVVLVLSFIAYLGVLIQVANHDVVIKYTGVLIYAAAAYAAVRIVLAIVNTAKARRRKNYVEISIRALNLTDALLALFLLSAALIERFGTDSDFYLTIMTAALTGAIIIGYGIYMIINGLIQENRLKNAKTEEKKS